MIIGIDASRAFIDKRTGTENYSYHIIRHMLRLPASKKHHFVLFTRPNAVIPDWTRDSYAEVVTIPLNYLWTQIGLAKATWETRLDVLWVPAHTLPILRKPGLKTVVTIHGLEYKWLPEYNNLLQRWYLPLSTAYAARYSDRLIAVSAFTKNQLVHEMGIPPSKIDVIHEGVTQENGHSRITDQERKKILACYGILDKHYILTVGTVQPRKNIPALVAAFSRVTSDFPDIKCVIAGSKGWQTDDIFRAPNRHGIQEAVVFTGRVDDTALEILYTSALLYIQSSVQEGFGLPVLEAMKNRIPVVSSDGGALPEVVGDAGKVVKQGIGYIDRLADAISELLGDANRRRLLVNKGFRRVQNFSWERAAESTLKTIVRM